MTGPLAPLFAQVREAVEFGYGGDPNYRPYYEEGIAALSSIERHVQAQRYREKVLRREVDRQLGRHLCYTSESARKRFWEAVDVALPAREKEEE